MLAERPHAPRQRRAGATRRIGLAVTALYGASALAYLGWRLTVFNADAPVFSTAFYLAELYAVAISLIVVLVTWRPTRAVAVSPPAGLTVDVFVTTYNEPIEVVRRTLLGCRRIAYPHQTWLLDDGNRAAMRALAGELGCRYLAREHNTHAKAGNLNNALQHSQAEFVALLDADNVPRCDFLDRLLGYFADERLAYVQTPQDFYNTNSFQHAPGDGRLIWNEQSYFHHVKQPGCDGWNATVLCGSSAVVRRTALDDVGGFAVETVTEDIHTGIRMMKRGWRAAYHPVALSFGIAPADLDAYLRQRLRWGLGNLQVCREERLPFTRGLTWAQRVCYLSLTIQFIDGWHKLIFYFAPAAMLLIGLAPFVTPFWTFCAFFAPFMLLQVALYEVLAAGFVRPLAIEAYSMARFATYCLSTMGLFRRRIRFSVSSKMLAGRISYMQLVPTLCVMVASAAGLVSYGARLLSGIDTGLAPGVAVIVTAWAVFHIAIAGAVIRNTLRTAANRDCNAWFRIPLPVTVKADGGTVTALTTGISLDRLTLRMAPRPGLAVGKPLSGTLHGPGISLPFRATVDVIDPAQDEAHVDARLSMTEEARDALDVMLHASTWYRPLIGQHEAVLPIRDRLARSLGTRQPAWQPLLWRPAAGPTQTWRCGFHLGGTDRMVLDKAIASGTMIAYRPAGHDGDERRCRISAMPDRSADPFADDGLLFLVTVQPAGTAAADGAGRSVSDPQTAELEPAQTL